MDVGTIITVTAILIGLYLILKVQDAKGGGLGAADILTNNALGNTFKNMLTALQGK